MEDAVGLGAVCFGMSKRPRRECIGDLTGEELRELNRFLRQELSAASGPSRSASARILEYLSS